MTDMRSTTQKRKKLIYTAVGTLLLVLVGILFLGSEKKGLPPIAVQAPMAEDSEAQPGTGSDSSAATTVPRATFSRSNRDVVTIDPVMTQTIGVRTARVEIERLRRTVRTTGRFVMDEQGKHTVSLKVGGWIEKLYADYNGKLVTKDQPLLDLYSPELVSTQEEYLLALNNARQLRVGAGKADAQHLLAAARRRLDFWDLNESQISHLEETGTPRRTITFYAPISGEVMNSSVSEGLHIEPGQTLMAIVDISRIWLIVDVYEQALPWVKPGATVQIELPSEPGQMYEGRVDFIYHMMNEELRTARARIVLPGRHGGPFKPGMYATAYLTGQEQLPTPVVPEEAVVRTGERELVIVALGNGKFRPQSVRAGYTSQGQVQILEGLEGGEQVVTSAQFLIDSEARLRGVVAAMLSVDDAPDKQAQADTNE